MEYPQFNRKYYIFKWPVFHCYVSLLDCTSFFAMTFRICWMLLATTVFFGESCDRRQRAARNFEKDFVGWDGLEFTSRKGHFPAKLHNIWAENRRIPWRFVPGSSHHVAASPRRSRHFMKARVPREIFTTVGGLGTPHPTHILLFFSGGSCWCFGIHQWHNMICSIKQKIDTEHVFNVSNFPRYFLELFRQFVTTHISKLLQSVLLKSPGMRLETPHPAVCHQEIGQLKARSFSDGRLG